MKPQSPSELIICFLNTKTGQHCFESCITPRYIANLDEYVQDHPDYRIINVFNARNDILKQRSDEQTNFVYYCEDYGLTEDDYMREIIDPKTAERYNIIGVRPHNRKYKILLKRLSDNITVKVTRQYVQYMINAE